jgi:hypothetical protein
MPTGERRARRGPPAPTKPASVTTTFVLPPEVKAGTRSHLMNDELREGLLNWSPDRVVDYLLQIAGWDLDRRILELCVIAHVDVAHAVAGLRRQMQVAVDVNDVRWDEVREFVARLERVLVAIRCVGHDHPREAADLAWEFLRLIRGAADAVSGEDELQNFFDEVVTAAHELTVKAGIEPDAHARKLIGAFVTGSGYGMGEPAIELVKGLDLSGAQSSVVAAYAPDQLKDVSESGRKELEELARYVVEHVHEDGRS